MRASSTDIQSEISEPSTASRGLAGPPAEIRNSLVDTVLKVRRRFPRSVGLPGRRRGSRAG
jgi:hypothetical protein